MVAYAGSSVGVLDDVCEGGEGELRAGSVKEQAIVQIRLMNPGATRELLEAFTEKALSAYLAHLKMAQTPRGGEARWVRTGETRGICRYFADAVD